MQHWETVADNVALPTISALGEKNFHFNSSEELDQELCRAFLQFIYFNKEQRGMLYSKTVDRVKVQCGCCIRPEESLLLMCTKFLFKGVY